MSVGATTTGLVRPGYRPQIPAVLPTYEDKLESDVTELECENQRLRLKLGKLQTELNRALAEKGKQAASISRLQQTRAVLRAVLAASGYKAKPKSRQYAVGRLHLNLTMQELRFDGHTVPLSPGEAQMLVCLFAKPDTLIVTDELTSGMYGKPSRNSIRSYISRVRAKLETIGARGYLNSRTGWGAGGYWITDPDLAGGSS